MRQHQACLALEEITTQANTDLLTFKEVVGPEAFTVLDVFHHVVGKLVHVARCPFEKIEIPILIKIFHKPLSLFYLVHSKTVSATGLWKTARVAASMHKIADLIFACLKKKPTVQHFGADFGNHQAFLSVKLADSHTLKIPLLFTKTFDYRIIIKTQ